MKKIILIIPILLIVIYLSLAYYTDYVDNNMNPVILKKPYKFTDRSTKLYNSFEFVGDLHCDQLMWRRDPNKKSKVGHLDIPRMQEGGMAFQAFTIVTKSPANQNMHHNDSDTDRITALVFGQRRPIKTWFSLYERALFQCKKLHKAAEKNDKFSVITSKKHLKQLIEQRKTDKSYVGGMLGIEGAHCLEGSMENFYKLVDAGVRMIGPTHFFDNEVGGSAHGMKQDGLTEFGKALIKEMNQRNIIIDLAHSSPKIIDDVLNYSTKPVLTSHTGVKATCDSPRNLSDDQLTRIAQKGGLIAVSFFPEATCGNDVKAIVNAMKHVSDLVGVEHVALGSDYDGSVEVPFDATGFPLLVEEMLKQGYSESDIRMIMGDNLKAFLLANLPD